MKLDLYMPSSDDSLPSIIIYPLLTTVQIFTATHFYTVTLLQTLYKFPSGAFTRLPRPFLLLSLIIFFLKIHSLRRRTGLGH